MEVKNLNDNIFFSNAGLTKKILFSTPDVLCFVLSLLPGQAIPDHRHENSALVLTVLKGRGQARVNGKLVSLVVGTILLVDGQEDFGLPAVEDELALLATLSPNPENPAYSQEVGGS